MLDGMFANTNYTAAKVLLDAVEVRHRAIASNLANVQTPGYRRVDLAPEFQAQFSEQLQRGDRSGLRSLSSEMAEDATAVTQRLDGNNVSLEHELFEMNRNSLQYQFLTDYLSSSLKHLRTAITGRNP